MRWQRVAIIGVGLMGGSLGLALKSRDLADTVVGVGRRKRSLTLASRRGACDEITLDVATGVRDAELVVLATPVGTVVPLAKAATPHLNPQTVVTDVASTKSYIVRAVETSLRDEQLRFVGGHPLVGSERKGAQHARGDLYEGATVVLTPVEGTDPRALEMVTDLWQAVGATVALLSPEEHDAILAQTSHLPHLVSAALINALARGWGQYVGPGFLDATRIAASDPGLWKDIFLTNAAEVTRSLARFRKELQNLENALAADPDALQKLLARAQRVRHNLGAGMRVPAIEEADFPERPVTPDRRRDNQEA
jgi:prephenate dehydrogenase